MSPLIADCDKNAPPFWRVAGAGRPPLVVMTCYGRPKETGQTLEALAATTDLDAIQLVVVNNSATPEMAAVLDPWWADHARSGWGLYHLPENVGCPRALNLALERHRAPGQAVVKIDNDVALLTPGWVDYVAGLVTGVAAEGLPVAMVGPMYDGALDGRLMSSAHWRGRLVHQVRPVIGHAVWHSGAFIDRVGYFDVLDPAHLYGFEDLLMSHKAAALRWLTLIDPGWRICNLQRQNSLGRERDARVEERRPLYEARARALASGEHLLNGPDGMPVPRLEREEKV
jgi:hypothetical protein